MMTGELTFLPPKTWRGLVTLRNQICPLAVGYVYFVTQEWWSEIFVKIGYTKDFATRWAKYQTDNVGAFPALLIKGDIEFERYLHQAYAALRKRGEWFRLDGPLAELLRDFGATPAREVPEFHELNKASARCQ